MDSQKMNYIKILQEELVPAMGCTEPIAIAFCAAKGREVLGCIPERILVEASGNIIKNVKSVIVPNTGGLKGIEASAAAGVVAGDASKVLEVIAAVTKEEQENMAKYLHTHEIKVLPFETDHLLDIQITMYAGADVSRVRISDYHSQIVEIEKNHEILFKSGGQQNSMNNLTDRSFLTVEGIVAFAESVKIELVKDILDKQISCNYQIAQEGLNGNYGANIGSTLLHVYGDDVKNRAKAYAAAGSDARMSGCELPVIINSGSGNQGMTTSLPVIVYAKEYKIEEERLYRALIVANLITIHLKTGIGRLSAYCGAISAGSGAGAGIAYLLGGDYKTVAHTIVNSLAITSGIVCDGAKASCAAKIAMAVESGLLGYYMYKEGQQFYGGDGIISKGVENTIANIGRLGKEGMKQTDKEIIQIMTNC